MNKITFDLSSERLSELDALAESLGINRSQAIRKAIEFFIENTEVDFEERVIAIVRKVLNVA